MPRITVETLEVVEYRPGRALQGLRRSCSPTTAGIDGQTPTAQPALLIERRSFLADEPRAEVARSLHRGNACNLVAELKAT
ncbi:hypothetical protein [Sphingomonas gellani]|uniref:hypothetical protein n=1 Tax=Sphingomonas gellani TaxID=1166340 RepID=UPI001113DF9E|nr:hypothetical protein [Sphingomonas gellani]